MNNKEAELVLECMAIDMTGALCDTKEPMRDVLKQRIEAINIAQKVLRENGALSGESLTFEQLKNMVGQPVWIENLVKPSMSQWRVVKSYHDSNVMAFSDDYYKLCSSYGKTWIAYSYPPAKIDREAWKPCEECESLQYIMGANYCEKCGRPLTDEAWNELEKRIMGE